MALHAVNPLSDTSENERRLDTACVPVCPICEGKMETVYQRNNQHVCVCVDCHTGVTVPDGAWEVVRIKKQTRWMPKP